MAQPHRTKAGRVTLAGFKAGLTETGNGMKLRMTSLGYLVVDGTLWSTYTTINDVFTSKCLKSARLAYDGFVRENHLHQLRMRATRGVRHARLVALCAEMGR